MKKALNIYEDMYPAFVGMPNEELGQLMRDMMEYRFKGVSNREEDLGWSMIKSRIDAAAEWEEELSKKRSNSGKMGGRPRKKATDGVIERRHKLPHLED